MTADAYNFVTTLQATGRFIDATFIRRIKDHPVDGRKNVVNPNPAPAYVGESPRRFIPPFSSTVLVDTSIEQAESVLFFRVVDGEGIAGIVDEPGWHLFGDLLPEGTAVGFPVGTPLWRGPQDDLGTVEFDPAQMLGETSSPGTASTFRVKVNLWFAPAGTDCFIHNQHDFLETHTQIHGLGRMQKFTARDHEALYEDVLMSPGHTHVPFCGIGRDGGFIYPWHQYRADSDCVWLAVEYHAEQA